MERNRSGAVRARWSVVTVLVLALLVSAIGYTVLAQDDAVPQETAVGTPYFLPLIDSNQETSLLTDAGANSADAYASLADGDIIPNQWIVLFQSSDVRAASGDTISVADLATNMVDAAGGELLHTWKSVVEGFVAILPADAVAAIAADPRVASIEPDRIMRLDPSEVPVQSAEAESPDASQKPATWGLDRIDQRNLPLNQTFNYNATGLGVHVYILDSGIRSTHTEFTGRIADVLYTVNDGNGGFDCNGHGTHVAGTVAGTTWGVAKRATIHSIRVLDCGGSGPYSDIIIAMEWVRDNHIKPAVVNMSLGGTVPHSAQEAAVRNLVAAGVIVVVAAGNENHNACSNSPAREPLAITVGAIDEFDSRASYSNYGSCLDIFAPGTGIVSASNQIDTGSREESGTSMASPHVAGAAALFLQANKSASPAQVAAALINNSTPGKISDAGAGSPNRLLYTGFIGVPTPTPTTIPDRLVRMIFIRKVGAGTPTLTPTRTPTRTPTATGVACTSAVVDGGFENDSNLWTHYSSSGYSSLRCTLATCEGAIIRSGSAVAWLGGADDELSILEQQVTVPNSAAPVFSYWYNVGSQETTCGYDSAASYVKVGALEADLATHELCDSNETSGWRNQIVNLSAYAGQTVTIGFRVLTDSSVNSNFFVDDVSLYASNACLSSSVAQGDSTPVPMGDATPQPSFGNDAPRIAFP